MPLIINDIDIENVSVESHNANVGKTKNEIILVTPNKQRFAFHLITKTLTKPLSAYKNVFQIKYKELPDALQSLIGQKSPEDDITFHLAEIQYDLAETVVTKTKVHRELIGKTTPKNKPGKTTPQHKGPSRLYLERLMHDDITADMSDEQLINMFFSNPKYNELGLQPDEFQKLLFKRILEVDSQYADKVSVFHAASPGVAFLNDLITEFLIQMQSLYQENYKILRVFPDFFEVYSDIVKFKQILERGDQTAEFRETGVCANVLLFGSNIGLESTIEFFLKGSSLVAPDIKKYIQYFFERLEINADYQIFQNLFNNHFKKFGVLYQMLINQEELDHVALPAKPFGYFYPLITKDGRKLEKLSEILTELQKNPNDYKEYQSRLQVRLFLDDKIFHDTDKVKIHTYYGSQDFNLSSYKKALSNAVSNSLTQWLLEDKKVSLYDLKQGAKLQTQFKTVYENITGTKREISPSPYILSIPRLIKRFNHEKENEKNILSELVEILLNEKDITLNKSLVHPSAYSYGIKPPVLGNVFFENTDVTAQILILMSNKSDLSAHQKQIQQQLKTILYHRYIRNGDMENALNLAKQLGHPIQEPVITDELHHLQHQLHEIISEYMKHPNAPFLEKIAQLTKEDKGNLIQLATVEHNWSLILWLLDHGMQIPEDEYSRANILHIAAKTVDGPTFAKLLEKVKFDVNAGDSYQMRPIHYAVMSGNWALVDWLEKHQATINPTDESGKTILHHAMRLYLGTHSERHEQIARLVTWLIKNGIDIDVRDKLGRTPLHDAAESDKENVELLIRLGANKFVVDASGQTTLTVAAVAAKDNISYFLINNGVETGIIPDKNYSVLHLMCAQAHPIVVESLLSRPDINLDQKSEFGTPLEICVILAEKPRWNVANLLLQKGARTNIYDDQTQEKMIANAIRDNQWEVLYLFRENGMSPEKINPLLLNKSLSDYCKLLRKWNAKQPNYLFNPEHGISEKIAAIEHYLKGDITEHRLSILRNSKEIVEIFKEFNIEPAANNVASHKLTLNGKQ